ncbi:MAG: hypothetical protein ABSF98_08030 [Bryobacteraceae bacterium]|jgi:hypothetical protein
MKAKSRALISGVGSVTAVKRDSQVVKVLGRNLLIAELLGAGLEVALPIRDRGIDLIAYADKGRGPQEVWRVSHSDESRV